MKEYTVCLKRYEDLEEFYLDMETPGGSLYIPNRAVDLKDRRQISRNTVYLLTDSEAILVSQDERVLDVVDNSLIPEPEPFYTPEYREQDKYGKSSDWGTDFLNWGIVEHSLKNPIQYMDSGDSWGIDDEDTRNLLVTSSAASNFPINILGGSGKNVDVIIWDGGHPVKDHPEFAKNPDGTGGSRFIEYDWYQHDPAISITYDYSTTNFHANHVAGTAAGNRLGWARDANIYGIHYNEQNAVDYFREFHRNKPINPETGRKNPTIVNGSWGSTQRFGNSQSIDFPLEITYRGNTYSPGGTISDPEELFKRKLYPNAGTDSENSNYRVGYLTNAGKADIDDAIAEGIIFVGAAGNAGAYIAEENDLDWDNTLTAYHSFLGTTFTFYANRPPYPNTPNTICVGALDITELPRKTDFSNRGPGVDIFAAGDSIIGPAETVLFGQVDPRNSSYGIVSYSGTSMASPQICGVLACLLEVWPSMTAAEAKEWLITYSRQNAIRNLDSDFNPENAFTLSRFALDNSKNRIMYFEPPRPPDGNTYPQKKYKLRSDNGLVYPRTRLRRRG